MTAYFTPETPTLPPTDLPYDDGVPLESNRHRIAMNTLIASAHSALAHREDYFAGGNMFIYYSLHQVRNQDFRGPDFFVVLNVDGQKERKYWATWEEEGRYPDVIVEFMSASTAQVDLTLKRDLYATTFQTQNYFVYDPFNPDSFQGWQQQGKYYQDLSKDERGWLWCEALGLWLGPWQGTILRETAPWLRFYSAEGDLILFSDEQERQRAEDERQERYAAIPRLLAMGLTPGQVAEALNLTVEAVEAIASSPA